MSATGQQQPVDMERMRDAADNDPEFMRQLVEVFLDDADAKLRELEQAIAASDVAAVGRTAHQLKGSSSNIGAARLGEVAKALELRSREGSLTGAGELCRRLAGELAAVHVQLEPILRA